MSRIRFNSKPPMGIGSRIIGTLFFFFFFAMGALFCVFIGRECYLNFQTRGWPTAECVIVESRVEENRRNSDNPYQFVVRYEFQWQGRTYSSTNWARKNTGFSEYSKAERMAGHYALDTKSTCLVNPSDPSTSILEKPTLWIGLVVFLPLIFVGIGLIGITAMWRSVEVKEKPEERILSNRPALNARGTKLGRVAGAVFFSFFLVIGSVVTYLSLCAARDGIARPTGRRRLAEFFPAMCKLTAAKSTTYSVDVLYSYEFNGREYRSNRYGFMTGSSSGYKGKAEIAARYQPGAKSTCYVNPADPLEAVLHRGFTATCGSG
ncbi:MAG: DUF3592 domain-containing protein [Verrucomicrobia bacterium]|nr:DUF3592 domain-containing protein [Verrucomicrobiota bacterium]